MRQIPTYAWKKSLETHIKLILLWFINVKNMHVLMQILECISFQSCTLDVFMLTLLTGTNLLFTIIEF